jgi:hypothetical protein
MFHADLLKVTQKLFRLKGLTSKILILGIFFSYQQLLKAGALLAQGLWVLHFQIVWTKYSWNLNAYSKMAGNLLTNCFF